MLYGKMVDGIVQYMQQPLKIDGMDVFTNDEAVILAQGYKPIIHNPVPEEVVGAHWEGVWTENENDITLEWVSVENPESLEDVIDVLTGEVEA